MADNAVSLDLQLLIKDFQKNLASVDNSVKSFNNDFQKNSKNSTQAWNSFVGNLAAKGVELAISSLANLATSLGGVGVAAVKNAGELERMTTELGVLLGSASAGEAQLKQLQQFAASSPFQLPGIVEANKLLLSFGTSITDIPKTLEVLGNVAAGSGKPLSDLARIFGQVQAETKLSLERLNQLNDAGVDLGSTLAQKLGIPLSQVRKAVTDGKVSFDLFRESITSIQEKGGVYADAMIKQSETLQGRLSSLEDNIFNLSGSIGQALFPSVKSAVDILISFVATLQDNIENIAIAGKAFAITAGLVGTYLVAVNAATIATNLFALAQKATPWGLAITAITAIGAGVFALIKYWDELKLAALNAIQGILIALHPLESVLRKFLGIDTSVFTNSIISVGDSIEEMKAKIAKKNEPIVDAEAAARDAENVKKAAEKAALAKQELLDKERAIRAQRLAEERIHTEELALVEEEARLKKAEIESAELELSIEERNARNIAELEAMQAFEDQKLELAIQAETVKANAIADAKDRETKLLEVNRKAELQRAQLNAKQEIDLAKKIADNKAAVRAQDLNDQAAFFSAATSLSNSSNKTLAAIGKAAAITQIAIQTPKAVASSFAFGTSTGGPPLGFILASIAATAMAAQAAQVAGINFAQGGIVPGTSYVGDRVPANVNSGEMVLNKRQQSTLFNMANSGVGGENSALLQRLDALEYAILNQPVILIADDNEIARSASRGVQNGVAIGYSR